MRRLLHRVAAIAESHFIGGSFLTPLALRYDLLNKSRYSVNKSCVFLSFPYFAIAKPRKRNAFQKGDRAHPARALFQTQYHLLDTTGRDMTQSIKVLDARTLKECIRGSYADTLHLSSKVVDEIIHVPQVWAVNLGSSGLLVCRIYEDCCLHK